VLSIPLVGVNKGHPAVFPPELPAFFIRLLSPPNGLVVDPFAGSGMTGIAAMELGRDCVLIDNSSDYARLAFENLHNVCKDGKFEIELCLKNERCIYYPKKSLSPLMVLRERHGLKQKDTSIHSKKYNHAVRAFSG
jgi:hypothetical protein